MKRPKTIENRKFIQLLTFLSQEEFKAFDRYVQSPYFNSNKKLKQLVSYLRKYHPNYQSITPQKVFKLLFGNKTFSEQILNDTLNKAKYLLEGFMAQQWFEQNAFMPNFALLNRLRDVNATWFFNKTLHKFQQQRQQQMAIDTSYYQENLQLLELELSHRIRQNNRTANSQLQRAIDREITSIFIISKLQYYCVLQNRRSSTTQENWEISMMPEIFAYLQANPQDELPPILVWRLLALLLKEPSEETHYFKLKKNLEQHHQYLSKAVLRQMYTAVITYCTKQAQMGKENYWEELLSCYELMLQENILLVEGYIQPPVHFQNIVSVALLLKKYTWTESFIQQYKHLLPPSHQISMISFCSANCHFFQQQYSDCIAQLQTFALVDDLNYVSHKILLIKAYYESQQYFVLSNLFAAFNTFLFNHKTQLPKKFFLTYKNFIKIGKQLLKFQEEKITLSKKEQKHLQSIILSDLKQLSPLTQKKWLLQQTTNLSS